MIVSFDLTGIALLIILPPLITYLVGNAYELRHHWSNLNFNKIAKENRDLQREILDLRIKIRELEGEQKKMEKLKDNIPLDAALKAIGEL